MQHDDPEDPEAIQRLLNALIIGGTVMIALWVLLIRN